MRSTLSPLPAVAVIFIASVGCENFFDPCVSQCELAAGSCEPRSISSFRSFDDEVVAMRDAATSENLCLGSSVLVGKCDGLGRLYISQGTGFTSETKYYDSTTRQFIALTTTTDVADLICRGRGYWPRLVSCPETTITEVICNAEFLGTTFEVGDTFP